MVRTKSSGGRKAVAEKAPRKVLASSSGGAGSSRSGSTPKSGKSKYSGAPACPRPVPEWQKGITNFFGKSPKMEKDGDGPMAGGSSNPDPEIEDQDPEIEEHKENVDANIEEAGASGSGSSGSSSSKKFKKNGIISDSEDED